MDIDNALEVLNVAHNDKVQRVDKIGVVNRKGGGQTETKCINYLKVKDSYLKNLSKSNIYYLIR